MKNENKKPFKLKNSFASNFFLCEMCIIEDGEQQRDRCEAKDIYIHVDVLINRVDVGAASKKAKSREYFIIFPSHLN